MMSAAELARRIDNADADAADALDKTNERAVTPASGQFLATRAIAHALRGLNLRLDREAQRNVAEGVLSPTELAAIALVERLDDTVLRTAVMRAIHKRFHKGDAENGLCAEASEEIIGLIRETLLK
jgi:hypothetical protein